MRWPWRTMRWLRRTRRAMAHDAVAAAHEPVATAPIAGSQAAMANDRVFLITGASTGIGAATARAAAEAGYRPVLAARSEDKLQALASELNGLAVRCDVSEWEDQQAL